MKRNEFFEKAEKLKNVAGVWQIVVDEESKADFVLGCFYDTDYKQWKVYINNERGRHHIRLQTESEEEAFDKLYKMIRAKAEIQAYCKRKTRRS